jgi:hypothetical protein
LSYSPRAPVRDAPARITISKHQFLNQSIKQTSKESSDKLVNQLIEQGII